MVSKLSMTHRKWMQRCIIHSRSTGQPLRCRYEDCPEANQVATDDEQVTCWLCRHEMGLPPVD